MRIGTYYRTTMAAILTTVCLRVSAADYVSVEPLWEVAVIEGNNMVIEKINTQTTKLMETAALQNTIALHFNAIKEWQGKYNSYLKKGHSYAEALRAGERLTAEGVRTVRDLMDLKKVMERNPEGIAATLSMNNLYIETIVEFIKTFRMLKSAISGEEESSDLVPTPIAEPVITPGSVVTTVTIQNKSNKDIAFDGKICFVLYGTYAAENYTGYFREKGFCKGGDYTIPAGGSKTYTVVFQDVNVVLGMPFAESSQSGQYQSNNCFYIGGSGYTCENISSSTTFRNGGSYTMTVKGDTHEWTSSGGDGGMLTGKERAEMVWALCDRMEQLNTKIRKLILSVAYYRVKDIWAFYTRGMFERHKGDIASNCLERWNRVQDAVRIMN